LEITLQRTHNVSLFTRHSDDSAASRHLEDIVAVMGHSHELGQGWVPEDGVVRQADVSDVEVNELGAVVVALPEGDRKADLPNRNRGAIGDSGERLGWLKLIVRHLEIVECLYRQDVEPCSTVDEGPGDLHIADDWRTKHREDSVRGCALEGIR